MRIELNAGGLVGLMTVASFGADYNKMLSAKKDVIKSFKAVESKVHNMNGGVGNLQGALESLERRVSQTEEKKLQKMETTGQKFAQFIQNTVKTDANVAKTLKMENLSFARENPWAVSKKQRAKSFIDKAKECIYTAVRTVGEKFVSQVQKQVATVKKMWDSTVSFMKDHWKSVVKIVVGAVVIVGLVALSTVTVGIVAGILSMAATGAIATALSSVAVATVVGVVQGKEAGEIFDTAADEFLKGTITGAITGAVSGTGGAMMAKGVSKGWCIAAQFGAGGAGNVVTDFINNGFKYFKENKTLSGFLKEYSPAVIGISFLKGMIGAGIDMGISSVSNKVFSKLDVKFNSGKDVKDLGKVGKWINDKANKMPWFTDQKSAISFMRSNAEKAGMFQLNSEKIYQKYASNPEALGEARKKFAIDLGIKIADKTVKKGVEAVKPVLSGGIGFKSPVKDLFNCVMDNWKKSVQEGKKTSKSEQVSISMDFCKFEFQTLAIPKIVMPNFSMPIAV